MLANLPSTVRKMLLCIFSGRCFQFSCHGVIPTVEKNENGVVMKVLAKNEQEAANNGTSALITTTHSE